MYGIGYVDGYCKPAACCQCKLSYCLCRYFGNPDGYRCFQLFLAAGRNAKCWHGFGGNNRSCYRSNWLYGYGQYGRLQLVGYCHDHNDHCSDCFRQ